MNENKTPQAFVKDALSAEREQWTGPSQQCVPRLIVPTRAQVAALAKQHGGIYESGAWRFPSPAKKTDFLTAVADLSRGEA